VIGAFFAFIIYILAEIVLQFLGVFVFAEFLEGFGFDLADAFAGDAELLTNLFERVGFAVF